MTGTKLFGNVFDPFKTTCEAENVLVLHTIFFFFACFLTHY